MHVSGAQDNDHMSTIKKAQHMLLALHVCRVMAKVPRRLAGPRAHSSTFSCGVLGLHVVGCNRGMHGSFQAAHFCCRHFHKATPGMQPLLVACHSVRVVGARGVRLCSRLRQQHFQVLWCCMLRVDVGCWGDVVGVPRHAIGQDRREPAWHGCQACLGLFYYTNECGWCSSSTSGLLWVTGLCGPCMHCHVVAAAGASVYLTLPGACPL